MGHLVGILRRHGGMIEQAQDDIGDFAEFGMSVVNEVDAIGIDQARGEIKTERKPAFHNVVELYSNSVRF
jgi:hypothetical protein